MDNNEIFIYETIQGDTWDLISFKIFNDTKYASEIIDSSPAHILTSIFEGGIKLIIPNIDTEEEADNLPAWRS